MIGVIFLCIFAFLWFVLGSIVYLEHLETKLWRDKTPYWMYLIGLPVILLAFLATFIGLLASCAERLRK